MKVLFFTSTEADYLADSMLHGFKSLFGADVVDYPKCEILYKGCQADILSRVRGNGFTLYSGLLDDLPVDRYSIEERLKIGQFDLVVFSDIRRQYGWFVQMCPWLDPRRTVVLDGADTSVGYPAGGLFWRRPYYWFLPRAHRRFLYLKREWLPETHFELWQRLVSKLVKLRYDKLRRISFSIPEEKIIQTLPEKSQEFVSHIVDTEVSQKLEKSSVSYVFKKEDDYYADIRRSRFGITTKRAGWDCLRHYEIAANGAVPCFRDLDKKPDTCAPHGLEAGRNCISYRDAGHLFAQIAALSDVQYQNLMRGALDWARANTTRVLAERVIEEIQR